jgi:cytidylate kinase
MNGVPRRMVVTLDGPAGSGKSTTAREIARRLGFRHLDSGALYRALTLALLEKGVTEDRWEALAQEDLADLGVSIDPTEEGFRVLLNGELPGPELRTPRITGSVPRLARIAAVREYLRAIQRSAAEHGGLVAEGRDMGTVIFPDSLCKVYLTASLEERARRRLTQAGKEPTPSALREEEVRIRTRDEIDEKRETAPLREPEGALLIDTTGLSFEEQVDRIVEAITQAIN